MLPDEIELLAGDEEDALIKEIGGVVDTELTLLVGAFNETAGWDGVKMLESFVEDKIPMMGDPPLTGMEEDAVNGISGKAR